jgi:hypothetical protein
MAQQFINVSQPNDGLGDSLRQSFIETTENFSDLYNNKVDKELGKGLSDNNFTDDEQVKLLNIEENAEQNVQSDWAQNDNTQDDYIKNKPDTLGFQSVYNSEVLSTGVETFNLPSGVVVAMVHVERGFKLSTEWSQVSNVLTITGLTATGKRVSILGFIK